MLPKHDSPPNLRASGAPGTVRQRDLDLIFTHVAARHGGHVAVHGPLGSGKSSLLRAVADPAVAGRYLGEHGPFVPVYADLQAVAPFSAERFWKRIAHLVARTNDAALAPPAIRLFQRPRIDLPDVESFLGAASARGTRLLLLLDEFEWALQTSTAADIAASRTFLAQLATLARRGEGDVAMVVATDQPLRDVERVVGAWSGSRLHASFTHVQIEPQPAATETLFTIGRPAARASAWLTPRDRAAVGAVSPEAPIPFQVAAPVPLRPASDAWLPSRPGMPAIQGRDDRRLARGTGVDRADGSASLRPPTARRFYRPPTAANSSAAFIDPTSSAVSVNGRPVPGLTSLEYNLLALLHRNAGTVCTKEDILRHLWGEDRPDSVEDTRVEKLVSRLRHRLETSAGAADCIRTVRGVGYRFDCVVQSTSGGQRRQQRQALPEPAGIAI